MRKIKAMLILFSFLGVIIYGMVYIPNGVAFEPKGIDYPPDETGLENANYSMSSSLVGTGYYDSELTGVGDTMHGLVGTGATSEITWINSLPDYEYNDARIRLYPRYYSKFANQGSFYQSGTGDTGLQMTNGDYYTHEQLQINQWDIRTEGTISDIYDLEDDYSKTAGGSVYDYSDHVDRGSDGTWWGDGLVQDYLATGVHVHITVGGIGWYTMAQSTAYLYDKLNIAGIDPNWYLTGIKIKIGWGGSGITAGEQDAPWGRGKNGNFDFEIYKDNGWYKIIDYDYTGGDGHTEWFGWEDISSSYGGWTEKVGSSSSHKFYYKFIEFDLPDEPISDYAYSTSGGYYHFAYYLRGKCSDAYWLHDVDSNVRITEWDVYYRLRWDRGVGTFRGSTGWDIASGDYNNGTDFVDNTVADNDGYIKLAQTHDKRNTGLIRTRGIFQSGVINSLSYSYDVTCDNWRDTEYGAGISDVSFQYYDGSNWITLSTTEWDINTPNLNAEDWYIAGTGIEFKFRASSYSGASGINGVAWTYTIDYTDILFTNSSVDTINFNGKATFSQEQGRYIDEIWDGVYFNNSMYMTELKIESNILDITYAFVGFDDGVKIYNTNSSFTNLIWDGDQDEAINFYWTSESDTPTITDFLQVNETKAYKPTLFNVTATDPTSNLSSAYVIMGYNGTITNNETLIPTNNGTYLNWTHNGFENISAIDNYNITAIRNDTALIDDRYKNSSYTFDNIIGDGNITSIEVSILALHGLNHSGYELNATLFVNNTWLENRTILGIQNDTWTWVKVGWYNLDYSKSEIDDLEIILMLGNLSDNSSLVIDYIEVNITYLSLGLINNSYTLTQNDGDSWYEYLQIPSGNYTYWYLVMDDGGNWATTKAMDLNVSISEINITIISIDNYVYGTTGHEIKFNITDSIGGDYNFSIDDVLVDSGTWISPNYQIIVDNDGYNIGVHNFDIYANTTIGNEAWYCGYFVVYIKPVFIGVPGNTSKGEYTPEFNVSWTAYDDNPYNYTLYRNETIVQMGIWDSYVLVKHLVKPSELTQNRLYVYKMVFQDYHNATIIDYWGLTINPLNPTISDAPNALLYEDESAQQNWTFVDWGLDNFSVEYYDEFLGWQLYYQADLDPLIRIQNTGLLINGTDFLAVDHKPTMYKFRCFVFDKNNNSAMDKINITILPHVPIVSDMPDGFYYSNDLNATLEWEIEDANLKRYWITVNTSTGYDIVQEGDLTGKTKDLIILYLYDLELDSGFYEFIIYVEDTYGNIANDTVYAENRGEQAGVEMNWMGLTMWGIVILTAVFSYYILRQTRYWEGQEKGIKRIISLSLIIAVGVILTLLSIFGYFFLTFTKLPEFLAELEANLGAFGIVGLTLGVAGAVVGGLLVIYYILQRRRG